MEDLTVGKLKELLKGVPDDMIVVAWSDYYPANAHIYGSGVKTGVNEYGDMTEYFVVDGV